MIYNEEFETLPREVLEALQLKRLKQVVQRVYHTVGFYGKAFDSNGSRSPRSRISGTTIPSACSPSR
jgi:phenylacetate-coenzyme A ligase PaaK-like adenylate-forming protein